MTNNNLEPTDSCGCGDIGYLTTLTLPIHLEHGLGKIHKVPVYQCNSDLCKEYSIPSNVSRRLDDLADLMEKSHITSMQFSWETNVENEPDQSSQKNELPVLIEAFTLQFNSRDYEDAKVSYIIPGIAILFESKIEPGEYYILRYEPNKKPNSIWFSFLKFYYDAPNFNPEEFLNLYETQYYKELAVLTLEQIDDSLEDEFGKLL